MNNYSIENLTLTQFEPLYSLAHAICVSTLLGCIIICIIGGNALVVAAILMERHLRIVSNYLILSLAIADLLVAMIVMPLSAVTEVSKYWWLGLPLCDLWICADVLLCTVSILHLCAIAIERCLAVSSLTYLQHRSAALVLIMVVICWVLSIMISLPARFHHRRDSIETIRVLYMGSCEINKETGYTIYSNLLAFDLPMLFMLVMYAQIYCAARKHIRKQHFNKYYHTADAKPFMHRICCYCCCGEYALEAKLNKTGPFGFRLIKCPDFQSSSSSEKPTVNSVPTETVMAAAAAAMQMASTMLSTTKEPNNTKIGESHEIKAKQLSYAISTDSINLMDSYYESKAEAPVQPITYESVSKLRLHSQTVDGNANIGLERGMVIVDSSNTIASSLQYADETPLQMSLASSFYSNSLQPVENVLSRPLQINNIDSYESIVAQSLQLDDQKTINYPGRDSSSSNFISLSMYYRKQRQKLWLHQHIFLEKKAKDTMKQISFNVTDVIKPDEEYRYRARLEQKRERRAIRTLAIITGCFVLCWLPFNINALLSPFLGHIHPLGESFLLWLGYMNSLLNPVIYTIFSKEFRCAFRKIICRYRTSRHRR